MTLPNKFQIPKLKNLKIGMTRPMVHGKLLLFRTLNSKENGKQKKIPNPAYKGPWVHPEIPNPEYKENNELYAYDDIGSVGIDIWQVKSGTIFDNIFISDSVSEAESFLADTYTKNKQKEKDAFDAHEKQKKDEEEAAKKAAEASKPADDDEDDDDDDNKDPHPDL